MSQCNDIFFVSIDLLVVLWYVAATVQAKKCAPNSKNNSKLSFLSTSRKCRDDQGEIPFHEFYFGVRDIFNGLRFLKIFLGNEVCDLFTLIPEFWFTTISRIDVL